MSQQLRHIFVFFVLSLATYGIWKYYFDQQEVVVDKPFTKGYSIDNLELQITNESGEFAARFVSPSLIRYTDSDVVQIEKPRFWTYSEGKENWKFRSFNAEYDYKNEKVKLIKQVEAESLDPNEKIQFKSNDLMVDLVDKTATTEKGINLQKLNLTMKGNQAFFDFTNNEIKVKENVQVVYKNNQ